MSTPSGRFDGLPVLDLDAVPDHDRRPPLLPRPVTGFVVLVLAVVAVVVLSGLSPTLVAGQGAAGPSAVIPQAGACVSWATPTARRTLPVPDGVEVVDCARVHQAEVTAAWRIGRTPSSGELEQQCRESITSGGWTTTTGWGAISARPRATFVRSGTGLLDWFACVRTAVSVGPRPFQLSLVGPLPDPSTGRPVELAVPSATLRWCLDAGERSVACDRPHAGERIGAFVLPPGEGAVPDCRDYARGQVGAAFDAGLRSQVSAGPEASFDATESWSGSVFFCDVRPPDGRQLGASVVGLGDAPLPLV